MAADLQPSGFPAAAALAAGNSGSARGSVLAAIRAALLTELPLPELPASLLRFPDPPARFAKALTEVGGRCVRIPDAGALAAALEQIPEYSAARVIVSAVPGVPRANLELGSVTDPHQLARVDFAVIPGEVGVAESGAVWVWEERVLPRAVTFLTQHLAIVLPASAVVSDLHEGYARVGLDAPGQPQRGFGMWISGPSKTADIEQSLVIGAHGARTCTVFLIG